MSDNMTDNMHSIQVLEYIRDKCVSKEQIFEDLKLWPTQSLLSSALWRLCDQGYIKSEGAEMNDCDVIYYLTRAGKQAVMRGALEEYQPLTHNKPQRSQMSMHDGDHVLASARKLPNSVFALA